MNGVAVSLVNRLSEADQSNLCMGWAYVGHPESARHEPLT
jgi:hypothetical protein